MVPANAELARQVAEERAASKAKAGKIMYCPACIRELTVTQHGQVPRHKPYSRELKPEFRSEGWCPASYRWVVHNGVSIV